MLVEIPCVRRNDPPCPNHENSLLDLPSDSPRVRRPSPNFVGIERLATWTEHCVCVCVIFSFPILSLSKLGYPNQVLELRNSIIYLSLLWKCYFLSLWLHYLDAILLILSLEDFATVITIHNKFDWWPKESSSKKRLSLHMVPCNHPQKARWCPPISPLSDPSGWVYTSPEAARLCIRFRAHFLVPPLRNFLAKNPSSITEYIFYSNHFCFLIESC